MAAEIGAVGDRRPSPGGSGTGFTVRLLCKKRGHLKPLLALAFGIAVIAAAAVCFAASQGISLPATSYSSPWTIYIIDTGAQFESSIALDSYDNVHISYHNANEGSLMYATNVGGSWATSTIDTMAGQSAGRYNSIAIDSADKIHIIYTAYGTPGYTESCVKYATNSDGAWAISVIDSPGYMGSIALDSHDNVHISYGYSGGLKYATNASGSWVISAIDNMPAGYTSIALDSADDVHICSAGATSLGYATNASGSWVTSKADDVDAQYSSLALDSAGHAHISYVSWTEHVVKYATNVGGSWTYRTIGPTSMYSVPFGYGIDTSIAVDSADNVHISYLTTERFAVLGDLDYATNVGGTWTNYTIDSLAGYFNSIALDSHDNVHISYYYGLSYATNAEPVIPEFGAAGVVVVVMATVCVFVALRRTSFPPTKD